MRGTLLAAGVAAALLACTGSELFACGDKSLSAGGIRMQRALAARYPASVLIYAPTGSNMPGATQALKLQETLHNVGHKYREVSTAVDLQAALSSGQFNVVVAQPADLAQLQRHLDSSAARIAIVGVAYQLTKAETAEAEKVFRFLIKAPSHAVQYLTTIADAVRSKGGLPRKA